MAHNKSTDHNFLQEQENLWVGRWACHSLISEKNCWNYSEFILPGVSHQVSAQKDIWFGRRWCLKNSKMPEQCYTLFDILMEWIQLFCVTYLPIASNQVSAKEDIWFGRWWCLIVLGNLWYANEMILATSESPWCWNPSIKFLLNRIYGLGEDFGCRIPRWLFSTRQSLCKWDDLSYFWGSILPEAFHQISAQEDIWFGRCWLKNSKMSV